MLKAIHSDKTYDHLIYLPEEYNERQKWPVIFYLHGVGGQGDYLEILKAHGLPKLLEHRADFPFLVVSPQCPPQEGWSTSLLSDLLDHVAMRYRIDNNRIYLTGIGTGAAAAWQWAAKEPEKFAALAPFAAGAIHMRSAS